MIFYWIIIWYGAFAGYYLVLKKKNINYRNHPLSIVAWYVVMGIAGALAFHARLASVIAYHEDRVFMIIGTLMVISALVAWYYALVTRENVSLKVSRDVFLAKTSEIFFQQLMIWILVALCRGLVRGVSDVLIFAVIFFFIHIPLMFVISWKEGIFFIAASLFGGIVFALCVIFIPEGWLFALAVHIIFYTYVESQKEIWGISNFYDIKKI